MAKTNPESATPISTLRVLWEHAPTVDRWQDVILSIASEVVSYEPSVVEALATAGQLADAANPADEKLCIDLSDAIGTVSRTSMEAAILLGYGLAKTWPASPEELDTWVDRARDLTGAPWGD
jgi:hypothetical protein